MKKIFVFLIILLGFIFLLFLSNNILYPSYLSVANACETISEEELNNSGYVVVGEYESCSDTIIIYYNTTSVNRHEKCHKSQNANHRLYSCDLKVFLFVNEMFCYSSEYLPEKIYKRIYLK